MGARAAVGLLALASVGCRDPTQITLAITTDIDCDDFGGVTVSPGSAGAAEQSLPSAVTTRCDENGRVGTLVVVPSDAKNANVAIKVVGGLGRDPTSCVPPEFGPGCVVARRQLRYIEHEPLRLDIPLRAVCSGIPCDATQTCNAQGVCVGAGIDPRDCRGDGCDDSALDDPEFPVVAGCGDLSGLEPGAIWPTEAYCSTRVGRSPHAGPVGEGPLRALSGVNTSTGYSIDAEGVLYGAGGGVVHAVEDRGDELVERWQVPWDRGGVPVVAASRRLILRSEDGVAALDADDGSELWRVPMTGNIASPLVSAYSVIARDELGVVALDPETGTERWSRTVDGAKDYSGFALSTDGTIVLVSRRRLITLDPTNGAVLVDAQLEPSLTGNGRPSIVVSDGVAFAYDGSFNVMRLQAIDIDTGSTRWVADDIIAKTVAIGPKGGVYTVAAKEMHAVDAQTGSSRWSFAIDSTFSETAKSLVSDKDGYLYFVRWDDPYDMYRVDGASGEVLTRASVSTGAADNPLAIGANGVLYVAGRAGSLRAIGP